AELAFRNGYTLLHHLAQRGAGLALIRLVGFRSAFAAPRPPVLRAGLAVEHSSAGDGDILLVQRVDERRVVHAFHPLEAREHHRVELRVWVELDRGTLVDYQVHIAPQVNGAGQTHAL